jgi:hypothetical protein
VDKIKDVLNSNFTETAQKVYQLFILQISSALYLKGQSHEKVRVFDLGC